MPGSHTHSKNIWQFDPRSIGGCQLWLDGADLSTMYQDTAGTTPTTTGSTKVYRWRDKSSLSNAFVSYVGVSGTDPAYQSGGGIYFSNDAPVYNSNTYVCMGSTTNFQNTPYYTIALCVYYQQGVVYPNSWMLSTLFESNALNDNGSARSPQFGMGASFTCGQTTPLAIGNYRESPGDYNGFQTEGKINTKTVMILTSGLLSNAIYSDGTGVASYGCSNGSGAYVPYVTRAGNGPWIVGWFNNLAPSPGKNSATLTGATSDNRWAKGYVYEVLFYNSELTFDQRQAVEGYLAWKWGTNSSLPTFHPFYSIKPLARRFNPLDIPGCALWLDGSDPAATGGGSTLSTWLDKSGNGNTATSGSGTISVSSTGLTFNGSTNYMTIAGLAGALANTSFVIFVVETFTGSGGYYFGDDNVNNGGSTDSSLHVGYRSQTNQTFAFYGDDLEDYAVSGSGVQRIWAHWLPTGANRVTRRNGAVDVTLGNSNRLQYFTAPRIGRVFTGNYYTGTISEIIVYTNDIGLQNILSVEGYLAWKWGLTSSLPSSPAHPFYKIPPSLTSKFNPTSILGCQLWMDASQETSANNATITTIPDRSGNGITLTAIGTISNYQNYRNGNSVYYFGGNRASNASFPWGTNFTHIVVSSSAGGAWLNSVGTLTTYVGLGNWALANINSSTSFEDPGSANSSANWTLTNGATVSVSNLVLSLSLTTTSGSRGQSTYGVVVNSARETSFSFNFPSSGTNVTFGWTDGTTPITFLITTSGTTPTGITCPSGAGTVAITGSSGATVLVKIYNTSYYIIAYSGSSSYVYGSWTSSGGTYTIFFATSAASTAATTFNNVQFDPGQGASVLPKTTGLAGAWNITSVGYTSGSTTLTNYAVNGTTRSSWTSTAYSGQTSVLPLYINGSSTGGYDTTYYAEIIHYNVALTTPQRQQVEGYLAAKWGIALPSTHPYSKIIPGLTYSGGITPSDLPNLVVWNRADNSSLSGGVWTNYGSGGTISCSGTLSTGVLNGLSVVNFTTGQTWTSSTLFNPTSYTFIQVVRQTTGTYGRVFQGTSGYNVLHGFWGGSNQVWYIEGNPSHLAGLPSTSGVNLWNIVSETRVASGAYEFRWNCCSVLSGTSSAATGLEGLAVNAGGYPAESSTCQLAEVILYSNVLNKVQLIGVENYLKVKWAL